MTAETLEHPASYKDGNLVSDENIRIEQLGIIMRQCSLASQENISKIIKSEVKNYGK